MNIKTIMFYLNVFRISVKILIAKRKEEKTVDNTLLCNSLSSHKGDVAVFVSTGLMSDSIDSKRWLLVEKFC